MKYSSLILNCLTAVILSACSLQSQKQDIIESRVEELLGQMTLQEKIGQMNQLTSTGNVDEMVTMAKEGKIGSFLNITDAKVVDQIQKAGRRVTSGHTSPDGARCHSRLQDYLSDSSGTSSHLQPSTGGRRSTHCRH